MAPEYVRAFRYEFHANDTSFALFQKPFGAPRWHTQVTPFDFMVFRNELDAHHTFPGSGFHIAHLFCALYAALELKAPKQRLFAKIALPKARK